MFDTLKNGIQKNNSFINLYHFWTNILVVAIFFNFIFFRTLFFDISDNSFIFLTNYIINYSVFIIFFLLLFYKFYGYLFSSQIVNGVLGIIFLITGTLKLYIVNINIYNIVELLFFIFIFIITIKTLMPFILSKNIKELKRGIYIFVFTTLAFSNLSYILFSANKIVDSDIFHYTSLYLTRYMEKAASISFTIIMIVYIIIFIKELTVNKICKYLIFVLSVIISLIIFKSQYSLIMVYFYNALGLSLNFPFVFYVLLMIIFLFTLLSFLSSSIMSKKYYAEFMVFTLFILAGLDINDFTLRLISIFSIIEMTEINNFSIDRRY